VKGPGIQQMRLIGRQRGKGVQRIDGSLDVAMLLLRAGSQSRE
jgi:hypothetical protein